MVIRLYGGLPEPQQFILHRINSSSVDPLGRQYRQSVAFLDTHHNIAATQIVKVIGERADGMQHALRIPAGLVLHPLALDGTLT